MKGQGSGERDFAGFFLVLDLKRSAHISLEEGLAA